MNQMNRKLIPIAVVVVIAVSLVVVLKAVPLISVTEDYGLQTFTIKADETSSTTLIAKSGWTVSGSYS